MRHSYDSMARLNNPGTELHVPTPHGSKNFSEVMRCLNSKSKRPDSCGRAHRRDGIPRCSAMCDPRSTALLIGSSECLRAKFAVSACTVELPVLCVLK